MRDIRLTWLASVALTTLIACPSGDQTAKPSGEPGTEQKAATAEKPEAAEEVELPPGDGPVAKVDGVDIPRDRFNREYRQTLERYSRARHEVKPALRERLKDNIVRRLVDEELIRQQAEKMQIQIDPAEREEKWGAHKKRYGSDEAFKAFLERAGTTADDVRQQFETNLLREKVFARVSEAVTVDDAEVKDFYEKNRERYDEAEQVQASHILFRLPANATPEQKAEKMKRVKEAQAKLKKGAAFEVIATEYGEDPTKDRGGDLGMFTQGRMVKPFEDAVWKMKVGQVSDVVETQFGYHIIKKTDHKKARKRPLAEVKEQILRSLEARKRNQAIRDALNNWKEAAKIDIIVKGDPMIMDKPETPLSRPTIRPVDGQNLNERGLEIKQAPLVPNTSDKPPTE